MKKTAIIMTVLFGLALASFAAYEVIIEPATQEGIQGVMLAHVNEKTINGTYFIYDAVTNDMKNLQFRELHGQILRNEGFYVSCSYFVDSRGIPYCVDLVVAEENGEFKVIESVLHRVDKLARDYSLISALWNPGYNYGIED